MKVDFLTLKTSRRQVKKINVPAGKGISSKDMGPSVSEQQVAMDVISEDEDDETHEIEIESVEEAVEMYDEHIFFQNQSDSSNSIDSIEVDNYVLVKFCCRKSNINRYYVDCVSEVMIEKEYFSIEFFEKTEKMGDYFTHPTVKDESIVEQDQLVRVLKNVIDLRRQRFNSILSTLKNIKVE
ncbi:hypothetical protein HHI36_006425 [Cryptolaemus montrouzieri]|uniref:Uncharacterized protein n=1 Tax=Cryptolaemus montrouzieri TaxID=559131 RepID=A0ABD2NX45_9CUCU